jgi:hypothetical protein
MHISELSRRQFMLVWWAFFWRFLFAILLLSGCTGAALGAIDFFVPSVRAPAHIVAYVLYNLAMIPSSMWALWKAFAVTFDGLAIEFVTPFQRS